MTQTQAAINIDKIYLGLWLLNALTQRVVEMDGKNYPKACFRGVFSSYLHINAKH